MTVWESLEKLKKSGPIHIQLGICRNIRTENKGDWNLNRDECFESWREYSGDIIFPVPGYHGHSPSNAYDRTYGGDMWNPDHPYGAARLRLLDHCIKWFKDRDL